MKNVIVFLGRGGLLKLSTQAFIALLCLIYSHVSIGQAPVYQIQGPHETYEGPYFLRIYVNYVQPPADQWTQGVDLAARTAGILNRLNAAFNPHDIYFIGAGGLCDGAPFQVITNANFSLSNLHSNALDIFDKGDSGVAGGFGFAVPSDYCEVYGSYGSLPGSHSEVVVHEVGHCLGLSHTHTGLPNAGGCMETGGDCPDGEPDCFCCGDYVCDTPIATTPINITVNTNCSEPISHPNASPDIFRNYMSYVVPGPCRDRFTTGQVLRMWDYIASAPLIQNYRVQDVVYPQSTPSGVSGNIVVESGELVISSPLQMIPNSIIRVKRGAKLRVASTITGACGKMWRGIVVEGTNFRNQTPTFQGQVEVVSGGVIEHAECGIDVQDLYDLDGPGSTGGGIVRLMGDCQIKDNAIGIRFGPYEDAANQSTLHNAFFTITDDFRGGNIRPVMLELNSVQSINIRLTRFRDLRSQCLPPEERAIGIESWNAGINVSLSSRFEQLFRGIRADKLGELNGSLFISGSNFVDCYKGMEITSSGSFVISGNNFEIDIPEACTPDPSETISGTEIKGMTTGFVLFGNNYFSDFNGDPMQEETAVGTDCIRLQEGMSNTVLKNNYADLIHGNRARGFNGYDEDGLLYICNTNSGTYRGDFKIPNGSIRKTQGEIDLQSNSTRAAGNVFSNSPTSGINCTIINDGLEIDYYFYDGDPLQDPGTPGAPSAFCDETGYIPLDVDFPNSTCADPAPCQPCPPIEVENWKAAFHSNRQEWLSRTAVLPGITDPAQQAAAAEAVRRLRIEMNRDANRILTHYSLDTLGVQTDSIVHWLGLVQTYPADARLARHYFFTGDFGRFDTLWGQIPLRYSMDESREEEYERLDALYGALRGPLQEGGSLHKLSSDLLDSLSLYTMQCDEAGFLATVILRRNGIERGPDCEETQPRPALSQSVGMPAAAPALLKIYPNPARDLLRIDYPNVGSGGYIRLLDMQGRLQRLLPLPASGKTAELPVGDMPEGLYLVQWFCNGQAGYAKVVISY